MHLPSSSAPSADYFYTKEHLFIVSELLKENLYEFGRYIRENGLEPFYTLARLKRIAKQVTCCAAVCLLLAVCAGR